MKELVGIPVHWKDRPFDREVRSYTLVPGEAGQLPSLADLVASMPSLPVGFAERGRICINGEVVPRDYWPLVKPKFGRHSIVTLHAPPGVGGSSGKVFKTVATIAVIATALFLTAGGAAPLFGAGFAAGTLGASLLSGAVLIGGTLAIAALTPPPVLPGQQQGAQQQVSGAIEQTDKPASLTGNVLAPGQVVPRVIGEKRMYPAFGSPPLIELVGNNEVVEAVLVLAGPHALSEPRIGAIALADEESVLFEMQEGWPDGETQSLVTRYGRTDAVSIELSRHKNKPTSGLRLDPEISIAEAMPQWHGLVTRPYWDEFWVNQTWVQGLYDNSNPTNVLAQPTRYRVRLRGDVAWRNLPEIHWGNNNLTTPFQKTVYFKRQIAPAIRNIPSNAEGALVAFKSVPGQSAVAPTTAGWTADSYFSAGAGNDYLAVDTVATSNVRNVDLYTDKVIFWLDPAQWPEGQYEIQMMQGAPYAPANLAKSTYITSWTTLASAPHTDVVDYFYYINDVGVNRIPFDQHNGQIVSRRRSSVVNENPIRTKDFAHIAIRANGRALDRISVLAAGYVQDWDGTGWNDWTTTTNPAPHHRDVLCGRLAEDPMPEDLVNDDELVEMRQFCIDHDLEVAFVADGKPANDVLNVIASTAYARPRQSESWGVFIDRDRSGDEPVQVFTPRNMNSFSWEKSFPVHPDGVRVRFDDRDQDHEEREIIVLDPEGDGSGRYEEIRNEGQDTEGAARARALFDMAQARRRLLFYSFQTSGESLLAERGSLIRVQHDALSNIAGFARVAEIFRSGGNITGLRLDGTIPVRSGDGVFDGPDDVFLSFSSVFTPARTGLGIRLRDDGSTITSEITAATEDANVVSFVTPFADPGSVLAGDCMVWSGQFGLESRKMIVAEIVGKQDLTANIVAVDWAPDLPFAG